MYDVVFNTLRRVILKHTAVAVRTSIYNFFRIFFLLFNIVTLINKNIFHLNYRFFSLEIVNTEWKEDDTDCEHEDLEIPFFDLATILNATNNFSVENKLGEGGFGPVYKASDKFLVDFKNISYHTFDNQLILFWLLHLISY